MARFRKAQSGPLLALKVEGGSWSARQLLRVRRGFGRFPRGRRSGSVFGDMPWHYMYCQIQQSLGKNGGDFDCVR